MGLGASQARFLNLTHQLTSVQRRGQSINQERSALASQMNQANNNNTNINPFLTGGGQTPDFFKSNNSNSKTKSNNNNNNNSTTQDTNVFDSLMSTLETSLSQYPGANKAPGQLDQAKLASLQAQDMKLELLLKTLDSQEQMIQTEIGAVQKVIGKNIEQSFKLMA